MYTRVASVWFRRALPLLVLLCAGCVTQGSIVPYPEVAYVPHPLHLSDTPSPAASLDDAEEARQALLERFSASPNRNPDGLGVLATVWLNSRMTLVTWQTAQAVEARNRVAYARTDAEQARVLADARTLYRGHWVFEGVLLGDLANAVSVDFYRPDGIYAVDDRGRKFYPEVARDADPLVNPRVVSRFGEAHYGYPRLVFPPELIGPETRSVSLYFAALNKRLRFTWVFDPDYEPPADAPGLRSNRGRNRLFPSR